MKTFHLSVLRLGKKIGEQYSEPFTVETSNVRNTHYTKDVRVNLIKLSMICIVCLMLLRLLC